MQDVYESMPVRRASTACTGSEAEENSDRQGGSRMAELVLIIGPCGAGKTTYARAHYPKHLHPDMEALIHTLYADPSSFRYHTFIRVCGEVLVEQATRCLLEKQQDVCLAIGGATRKERRKWIEIAHEYQAPVQCVRLSMPRQLSCVRRLTGRALLPAKANGQRSLRTGFAILSR